MHEELPTYEQLLTRTDAPAGSSWGLFPDEPERGMANFATAESVLAGARTIRSGTVFNLDYAVDAFEPTMSRQRAAPTQTMTSAHDDSFDDVWNGVWPQISSHLDGLRHRRAHGHGFYNGVPDSVVTVGTPTLGVQHWAETPIVGRAVLLDVDRWRKAIGAPLDHRAGEPISMGDVEGVLAAQESAVEPGDIVLVHTGWAEWFLGLDRAGRIAAKTDRRTTGFAQSREFLAWLWDNRVALLGTDTFAVEALPAAAESPFLPTAGDDAGMMHQELIAKLGCPLGELWRLAELAEECERIGRHSCFVTVKPLNLPGAVGSPCNATAIL